MKCFTGSRCRVFLVLNGMCITSVDATLQTHGDWTGASVRVSRWMCQNPVTLLRRAIKPAPSKGLARVLSVWLLQMRKQNCFQPSGLFISNVTQRGEKRLLRSYLKQSKTDACFGSSTRYFKPSLHSWKIKAIKFNSDVIFVVSHCAGAVERFGFIVNYLSSCCVFWTNQCSD